MHYIFTRKTVDGKHQVRLHGHEFLIDEAEARQAIENGQAYFKANVPVNSYSELIKKGK